MDSKSRSTSTLDDSDDSTTFVASQFHVTTLNLRNDGAAAIHAGLCSNDREVSSMLLTSISHQNRVANIKRK